MEASPDREPLPQPDLRGEVRLETDVIRACLQANQPVDPEKAFMIYVMQNLIEQAQGGE